MLNSVAFNKEGRTVPARHKNIIEIIEDTNSEQFKKEKTSFFINENI